MNDKHPDVMERATGTLVLLVYRVRANDSRLIAWSGGDESLALDDQAHPGIDLDDVLILMNDSAPHPPEDGLWRMEWPYRPATEQEQSEDECSHYYIGKPQWTRIETGMPRALSGQPL